MEYVEISAKTLNDAITKACIELGVSSDNLEYKVISEGSSGFLGFGSKPAIIKVRKMLVMDEPELEDFVITHLLKEEVKEEKKEVKETKKEFKKEFKKEKKDFKESKKEFKKEHKKDAKKEFKKEFKKEAPVKAVEPKNAVEEKVVEDPVKKERVITPKTAEEVAAMEAAAREFLTGVFEAMNLEVVMTMKYDQEEGSLDIDFEGSEMGLLIGKRGQTLDSLQYLTSLVVNKGQSEYIRIKLDTENYRKRRKDTLENLAKNIAFKVRKTRRPVSLEPMNPYERRIIHSALQNNKAVITTSEGEEPYRHVVVMLKK